MSKRLTSLPANTGAADPIAVCSATGEPVKTIELLPIGPIVSKRDGRRWLIRDAAHAQSIVEASLAAASPADIPVDYDHQLMFAAKDGVGGTAPASGWLSDMRVQGGHIVADVAWTAAAAAKIADKEYRYISPVFTFAKATGEIGRILNAALTCFPAITELAAVASADPNGDSMDLTALAAALGLPATATFEEIVAAANAAKAAASAQLTLLATAAGVPTATTAEAVATAIAARGSVDPTKYAPIELLTAANARITALETADKTKAATDAVDAATAAGKITPAQRDWALDHATKDLASFQAFLGSAPVVIANASAGAGACARTGPPETPEQLTADELAACAAVGVTPEAFLKALKMEVAHGRA